MEFSDSSQQSPPLLQTFRLRDGTDTSLPFTSPETGSLHLLWGDIQQEFEDIDHLETIDQKLILFAIDNDGELYLPLRIKHDPNKVYIVTYNNRPRPEPPVQEIVPSIRITIDHPTDVQGRGPGVLAPQFYDLLTTCMELYNQLQSTVQHDRNTFQQVAANTLYYHSLIQEDIEGIDRAGKRLVVSGKDIRKQLHDLQHNRLPELDYQNICHSTLRSVESSWGYALPRLFIVLPACLVWDDSDTSTHQFRLYFLCDNNMALKGARDTPKYVHLASHPGYNILQPQDFLKVYGDYALRILRMVDNGFSGNGRNIPSLESFKILWNCDSNITHHLSKRTFGPLLDKAITYLQKLSPPKWRTRLHLSLHQSASIRQYLDVQYGENTRGNMHRCLGRHEASWTCQIHAQLYLTKLTTGLGHTSKAAQRVELRSMVDADKFQTRTRGKRTLYTTILKLSWAELKMKWQDAYDDVWKTGTMYWEFDKPDPNAPPSSLWQRVRNLYPTNLVFNTLHPGAIYGPAQLQERSVRTNNASLNFKVPAKAVSALEYPDAALDMFSKLLNALREGSDWAKESQKVHMTPGKHGIFQTDVIFVYSDDWDAVFDLAKGAFVEGYTLDDACPKTLLSSVSLRRLTVSLEQNVAVDENFLRTLTSHSMQELNIAYSGHNVLFYTDHIVKAWHELASSFCLTLIDRTNTTHGQVVLQVALDRGDNSFPVNSASSVLGPSTTPFDQQQALPALQFMHWDCDHIFAQLSDYSASFLDMATLQHPITLTQFTLDISQLSRASLTSVQNILDRSLLEHFHVVCTPIVDPSLWAPIARVLDAIQWLILKSLTLSGDNINSWASLWPASLAEARQLLTLHIQATGSHLPVQALPLSHASVLLLHHLIFTSPQLLELQLVNVHLQEQHDWTVLVNSLDFLQTSLRLDSGSITQLLSVKPAAKRFLSQMETVSAGTERREQLVLHEFTLEIPVLSEQVLERIQRFLHMCTVKTLNVQCPLFDADKAQTFAQALGDLPWSAFQSVVLEGENVNGWLELLAKVDGLRLKCLKLVGTITLEQLQQLQQQVLSESSVLFIEQLIQAGTVVDHELVGMSSAGAI